MFDNRRRNLASFLGIDFFCDRGTCCGRRKLHPRFSFLRLWASAKCPAIIYISIPKKDEAKFQTLTKIYIPAGFDRLEGRDGKITAGVGCTVRGHSEQKVPAQHTKCLAARSVRVLFDSAYHLYMEDRCPHAIDVASP